jgi:hypothetical protein
MTVQRNLEFFQSSVSMLLMTIKMYLALVSLTDVLLVTQS